MTTALHLGFGTRRLPMLLQTEAAECGLACLAMVATHHGLKTDLPTLRKRFSLSLKGATMMDLTRMAGQMQLTPRALRAELEHLPQMQLPCVLHWDLNHFVVLVAIRGGKAVLHDPARGIRRLPIAELSNHYTGVVLELTPTPEFRPRVERQSVTVRQLLGAGADPCLVGGNGLSMLHAAVRWRGGSAAVLQLLLMLLLV